MIDLHEQEEALKVLELAREAFNNAEPPYIEIAIKQLTAAEFNYSACLAKYRYAQLFAPKNKIKKGFWHRKSKIKNW